MADDGYMETTARYIILRAPSVNTGNLALVVGHARSLKGARRIRDRKDAEYGAAVHGIRELTPEGKERSAM